jgi:hypothetical protein
MRAPRAVLVLSRVVSTRRAGRSNAGLCISPIFASRAISEMQNWFRGHIGNAYHVSPNRWIANMIKLLVIVGDLGDVP